MPDNAPSPENSASPQENAVIWDDSKMTTHFANVVNIQSTQEQFDLFFGTNHTWSATTGQVKVELNGRVIMGPHAAKRLMLALSGVVNEYEKRYGELNVIEAQE